MKLLFSKYPFFLYLLPVFFVLHGFTENYGLVHVKDAVTLTLFYLCLTIIINVICWLIYRNILKTTVAAFALMSIYFFFGTLHDTLKNILPGNFIAKYVFLLPFLLALLVAILIKIKKSKSKFGQFNLYLNTLFIILLLLEILTASKKYINEKPATVSLSNEFIYCKNCPTPDIYLIIADGYSSNTALQEVFNFDNSEFEKELQKRNFHVINNSFSNYNTTVHSIASLLNLNYLVDQNELAESIDKENSGKQVIRNNQTILFLKKIGYEFYNYSEFNFKGNPAATNSTFLIGNTTTITSQTLSGRIYKDLWYHLATNLKLKKAIDKYARAQLYNNNKIYDLTEDIAKYKSTKPKFVYCHLTMPHSPYFFDKDGNPTPIKKILEYTAVDRKAYIGYLQYANQKFLKLIDHIQSNAQQSPVIMLVGDHGFRDFNDSTAKKYQFMNLSSISLPDNNYEQFKDSSSLINQMRTFFNIQFQQKLPQLKDSTIFIYY